MPLRAGEEKRVPLESAPAREHDPPEPSVVPLEACDSLFAHADALRGKALPVTLLDVGGTIGAERHIGAPPGERQCQSGPTFPIAMNRDRPPAPFPSVAVRTVVHARAVQLGETIDGRQLV